MHMPDPRPPGLPASAYEPLAPAPPGLGSRIALRLAAPAVIGAATGDLAIGQVLMGPDSVSEAKRRDRMD